jgi:hypothetical protein
LHLWSIIRLHGDSPPLLCPWWEKDVVRDVFASFARDVGFHILQEQTHILSLPFF